MKAIWILMVMFLLLGLIAGFSKMSPTGAFIVNLPPQWDHPTDEFSTDGQLILDLSTAFFDPDRDPLAYSVSPGEGVSAGVRGDHLMILTESGGEVTITATDGKTITSKTIFINIE